ncbi:MAG: TetR/AcrR family transcriptional regulator [Thermodesulfobacteriota bacterium]
MTPKLEYKKKRTMLAILQAAEELFLQKPYSAITVDEIAAQAGVTKKTLYRYFPSKLSLYIHMFDDYLQRLHGQMSQAAVLDLPVAEVLRRMLEVQFKFTWENARFMLLWWTLDSDEFDGDLPRELIQSIRIWNRGMIEQAAALIKKGQQAGVVRAGDPELLVNLMSAVNKGIFIHTRKQSRLNIANVNPQELKDTFWELVSAGLFISPAETDRLGGPQKKKEARPWKNS